MTLLALTGVAALVALTIGTSFFVAQEFAYVAADGTKLESAAEAGDPPSHRAVRVTRRLSFMLSGAQVGITATTLLVGYIVEPALGAGLTPLLDPVGLPSGLATVTAYAAAFVFATAVQMVYGELVPKNFAIARPEPMARALSRWTLVYLAVAGPMIRVFDGAANRLLRAVGIEPANELPQAATPEELARIVRESRKRGGLSGDLSALLDRTLDFRRRTAGHAMVPRPEVVVVRADEPASRLVELLAAGHSRFPVIGADVDDLVGVVGMRDLLELPHDRRDAKPVREIARHPLTVPISLSLPALLAELRASDRELACVMDEFGGLAGVVTLGDVAEELVGRLADEDDLELPRLRQADDGSWLVPGLWHIDEVARATGVNLPESDRYETVGGLVMAGLRRLPQPGDRVEVLLPADPAEERPRRYQAVLTVESLARRVPGLVRLAVTPRRLGGGP